MSGRFKQVAAAFLIGLLAGGAGVNSLVGKQVDRLSLANSSLHEQLAATEKELQQVKESLKSRQTQVVSSLDVHVSFAPGKPATGYDQKKVQLFVENKVREWLQPLLGQEIGTLNYLLIPQIIDLRQVELDGIKYTLKVKLVVVSQRTAVYLEVAPENPVNTRLPAL
ncbi:MAG: hypothetical protein K6U04_12265 [Armatimonadetes bacterium]|nr:hypothetical protein [Armatimonadota bacterium]